MRPYRILICFFISASLFSQEQRTVEIIQAGKSIRNSIEYPDANILQRDKNLRVILFHDGARIESDVSYYYFNENSFLDCKSMGDLMEKTLKYLKRNYQNVSLIDLI